jgi:hypothetical protein
MDNKIIWFLARLIFDHEDRDDTFPRNVCSHTDYTALYLKRWQHIFHSFEIIFDVMFNFLIEMCNVITFVARILLFLQEINIKTNAKYQGTQFENTYTILDRVVGEVSPL